MSKVDLDKLMCSLTKVDIVGTYLASCFQDALREQGLACDDGKIKNINNKPDETEEPIEIKEGNYYKCNHAYNYFSLGSIYYSPKDGFLMDDYGHGIDITDKASYFEFAYTIDEYPTESKEDEEVKEPTNKIKKGGVYKCLCNCMNRNFINKGVYVSEEDNHLTNLFGESIDVGLIPQYFEELSIPDEEKPENAIEIKAGNWYRCLKTMPNLNFCKGVFYYSPNDCCLYNDDGESIQYGDRTSSFELVHLDKTVEEEMNKLVNSNSTDTKDKPEMAYLTVDKFGLVQLWNHKPEYNEYGECWQAWIIKGYFNEVAVDVTTNDYFRKNITFEESPKEIKI